MSVVRVADGGCSTRDRVVGELVKGSPRSIAATCEILNQNDVAVIQHEYGIYGGVDGDDVVAIVEGLRVPSIVIAHTVLKDPRHTSVRFWKRLRPQLTESSSCPRPHGNGCVSVST